MSDVAAYHVFVCALFPVQGGMWTGYGLSLGVTNNNGTFIILVRDFS
jgi:hypothetical protein